MPAVLIVGPGKYFGKEVALRFAKEGYRVALVSGTGVSAEQTAKDLNEQGCQAIVGKYDVQEEMQCKKVLEDLSKRLGMKFACAIFNVKESPRGNGLKIDVKQLNRAFAVNVGGALTVLQQVQSFLEKDASFIVTGGGYKDHPDPEKLALSASKGALHTLILALKKPCAQQHIHVKTVVIDGVVRRNERISPDHVAELFWKAHKGNETVITISEKI